MKLNDFIAEYKPVLQTSLENYLNGRAKEYEHVPFYKDTLDRLYLFSTSGKMLRGLLILLIYSFFEKLTHDSKAFSAAAAMELIQSALLVHDDIIDNDEMRRGKKTIYSQYADYGKEKNYPQSNLFGRNVGICVGDIAIFLAFDLLSCSSDKVEISASIIRLFARETHLVAIGEMIDVDMASNQTEPTVAQIIEMYRYKTARYSFLLPFAAGAQLGGATPEFIAKLGELGESTGILFQIQDDWLGLYGTEGEIGKPVGSDLREKKKTIYRSLLIEAASEEERKIIDLLSVEETLGFLKRYEIENKVNEYKIKYETKSIEIINTFPFSEDQKRVLLEVVDLIIKRKN